MPTYDYECLDCGDTFEKFQPITARPVRRCPACRTGKVRRLIGAGAGFIITGSGFYQTDYRSEEYKRKAKADKEPSASAGKTDGAKDKGEAVKASASKDAKKPKE